MSFLYFDCFSGVSGDMIIASLLDCGAPFEDLRKAISGLSINANLSYNQKVIQGISCTSFDVNVSEAAPVRHLADIQRIITDSDLPLNI